MSSPSRTARDEIAADVAMEDLKVLCDHVCSLGKLFRDNTLLQLLLHLRMVEGKDQQVYQQLHELVTGERRQGGGMTAGNFEPNLGKNIQQLCDKIRQAIQCPDKPTTFPMHGLAQTISGLRNRTRAPAEQ